MNSKFTKITFHGDLGEQLPKKKWNLAISSVNEAIHAVNTLTNNKFSNYFIQNNKLYAKYRILINGKDFNSSVKEINEKNWEEINNSELSIKNNNLETVDVVPILEGNDSNILGIFAVVIGIILIIASFGAGAVFSLGLFAAGLGLFGAGIMVLLTKPPKFKDFRNIDKNGGESYLFAGPINIIGEGGPCPIGYGRVLIGSQVISSSFKIEDYQIFKEV